ncbi:MAG: hypothetical protein Q8O16_02315 [Dehalococcoidia bacterium]|nr:hypothetical protein [Dehalococcoidia bacterium]
MSKEHRHRHITKITPFYEREPWAPEPTPSESAVNEYRLRFCEQCGRWYSDLGLTIRTAPPTRA